MISASPKPFKKIVTTFWLSFFLMIVCLSACIYFYCLLRDSRQNVKNLTRDTTLLEKEELDSVQLKKELATSRESSIALDSYFVKAHNPVPFEKTLEQYGTITNTKVLFEGLEIKKDPNRLDVAFSVDGNFSDLYRFLAMLESAPYEINITNVTLTLANPQGLESPNKIIAPDAWHAHVTLSVYSVEEVI